MEPLTSTGALARATGLSEKAVRLYADRGLLHAVRDPRTDARGFTPDQVERARRIALLRGLDLPLAEVADVLDATDPVAAFDAVWSARRDTAGRHGDAAERLRAVLGGGVHAPAGTTVLLRDVPERLLLALPAAASLPDLPAVLRGRTADLFAALTELGSPLSGPVHVELRSRATASAPADLLLCAPVPEPVRPPAGTLLVTDPAHREALVALDQRQADDQPLLVAVHDHLSTGAFASTGDPALAGLVPCGPDREVYLPSFGTGATGTVLEVAVPVRAAADAVTG
jgi:DNA-binding transcriptional MerR regulator